ncbi:cyclic pyranopterin monophosphate synthase MoaC [Anaerolineales bacterium]
MKDISHKSPTDRHALAETRMSMPLEIQQILTEKRAEKGDALEIARVAGVLAAKNTWQIIPFCHPIPLTGVKIAYQFEEQGDVIIQVEVKTHAPTGVEMEALTAASVTALTLYDMLKPHSHAMEIEYTRLLKKTGGKSGDYFYQPGENKTP